MKIKRIATRASLQRPSDCQITTSHELFKWVSDPMNLSNIIIQSSLTEEYNLAKEYLATRFERAKSVLETQKIHSFIALKIVRLL